MNRATGCAAREMPRRTGIQPDVLPAPLKSSLCAIDSSPLWVQEEESLPIRLRRTWARIRLNVWPHSAIFSLLLSLAAIGGMAASVLLDLRVRTVSFAGSDMKTLFASVWCFAHGRNAYTIANMQSVFAAHRVVLPGSWFAHAPVYPPTTLAFLLPLAALPMVPAIYSVIVVSAALFALAVVALTLQAAENSSSIGGRVAIAVVCACSPAFSFALSMANVSVAASSLCILAFVRRKNGSGWFYGILLAVAVLLKPHLAIWMLTGMLLLPERESRAVAARAAAVSGIFACVTAIVLACTGRFAEQVHGFIAILQAETASGSSMSTSNHEVIPVVAQIASFHSLLGFWRSDSLAQSAIALAIVAALGAFVAWRLYNARGGSAFMPALGAWIAFGLLATYHRAHDALLLLVLLPWLVESIRKTPRQWVCWAVVLLYGALNFSLSLDLVSLRIADGEYNRLIQFLLLRQAALADLGMLFVLLASAANFRVLRGHFKPARQTAPTNHVLSAS